MLFKDIILFSLLALQAGFSGAKPLIGHERREADVAEQGARLLRRASIPVEGGTVTGTDADYLYTYGLATCPGLAASGTAAQPGGTSKVLTHVQCAPDVGSYQTQINEWISTVQTSGMTNIKIVIDLLNPALVPGPLQLAQTNINTAAQNAAKTFLTGYGNTWRQSVADPAPSGQMAINIDGTITVAGVQIM